MEYHALGPAFALGFSAIGSAIGSSIAGAASHGVMSRVEEGHGKFVLMSVAPSTIIIYGFILMLLLSRAIVDGKVSDLSGAIIGMFAGLGFLFSAIYMGKVCATGIQASANQPSVFGKCFASIGVIESLALFVFVFSLVLITIISS